MATTASSSRAGPSTARSRSSVGEGELDDSGIRIETVYDG